MDVLYDGEVDGWMEYRRVGVSDVWMKGWNDGWMDGWMDDWMDG